MKRHSLRVGTSLLEQVSLAGDGVIDFAEFITLMHKYQESDVDAELRRAFKVFDRDNSGTISRVKPSNHSKNRQDIC